MSQEQPLRIRLEVFRSQAGKPSTFDVPVPGPASRILDALLYVREHFDSSLGFRYSCRAGMCGSCAVVVNGKQVLSCQTAIGTLKTTSVRVSPLRALPVLRDLMCDMAPFFASLKNADAALRPIDPDRKTLRKMPPAAPHRELIEGQNGCITCGACHSACEWASTSPGPAAMNRVLMLSLDERDAKGKSRLATLASESSEVLERLGEPAPQGGDVGALDLHGLGSGDPVCPVGIPLLEAMVKLKELMAAEDIA